MWWRIHKHAGLIADEVHVGVLVVVVGGMHGAVDGVGCGGGRGLRRGHEVVLGVDGEGHVWGAGFVVTVGGGGPGGVVLPHARVPAGRHVYVVFYNKNNGQ